MPSRYPDWLKKRVMSKGQVQPTRALISGLGLNTVCSSAACPNQEECYSRGTATFLLLGNICSRRCRFCAVEKGTPGPPDLAEPRKVAQAVAALGLRHAVVTSVTRDDLADGGAAHFAATIFAIREVCPGVSVEVLTPDFKGHFRPVDLIASALPEVFGHNVETVPGLYRRVRPGASYRRSLTLLERVKAKQPRILTKSSLMVGLGEQISELKQVMGDLRSAGCDIITIGQYLQPTPEHIEVFAFISPDTFDYLQGYALSIGFSHAVCGPFVRSSYRAGEYIMGRKLYR
ncbi:MAG: lipoyl synthase [Desulfocucumaceae bacterium]